MITPLILRQKVGTLLIDAERLAETAAGPLEHGMAAHGAILLGWHIPCHKIADMVALFVVGKLTAIVGILFAGGLAGAAALHKAAAAFGAAARHLHHQRHGKGTLRIPRAGQKWAEAALALHQIAAAHRAQLLADCGFGADIVAFLGLGQVPGKTIVIKLVQHLFPRALALFHIIQLLLHIGCEFQIGNIRKILLHPDGNRLAQIGNEQVFSIFFHIAAIQNGGNGGRIGGGAADAVFLHGADQRRLGVMGRRRGKMLAGSKVLQRQRLALMQFGQSRLFLLFILVIAAFLIHGGIARELQLAGSGAKQVCTCINIHGHAVIYGVGHLAGQKTAPDQAV